MRFPEQDRLIYGPYHNGTQEVHGDPLALYRRLVHHCGGNPNQILADLRGPDEAARFEATERLLSATAEAFGLQVFNPSTGEGMLERDVLAVAKDFLVWLDKKKVSRPATPTTPPPTEPASSAP